MQDQTEIAMLIAFGCFGMIALAVVIILFVIRYQRKMFEKEAQIRVIEQQKQIEVFRASIEAEEKQKEIIANNLHDSINPVLSVLRFSLTRHQSNFLENRFTNTDLDKDKELIDQIINDIRATCHNLIPVTLYDFGLLRSLQQFIEIINSSRVMAGTFDAEGFQINEESIPKLDQVSVFRICQEVLNNITKHTGCRHLKLRVFSDKNMLNIEFSHDGKGISNEEINNLEKKGLGLNSLKSRALILKGEINYTKGENHSFINIQIPIPDEKN